MQKNTPSEYARSQLPGSNFAKENGKKTKIIPRLSMYWHRVDQYDVADALKGNKNVIK